MKCSGADTTFLPAGRFADGLYEFQFSHRMGFGDIEDLPGRVVVFNRLDDCMRDILDVSARELPLDNRVAE